MINPQQSSQNASPHGSPQWQRRESVRPSQPSSGTHAQINHHSPFEARQLGAGQFGRVILVAPNRARKLFTGAGDVQNRQELSVLRYINQFSHPSFIELFDAHMDSKTGFLKYIDVEFVPGFTLERWVETHRTAPDTRLQIWPPVAQTLINAVRFLHEVAHIFHGDVQPKNIIINPKRRCLKLIDFGSACSPISSSRRPDWPCRQGGSLLYLAPEGIMVNGDANAIASAEAYSVGSVLFLLYFGYPPFSEHDGAYGYRDDESVILAKGMTRGLPGELMFAGHSLAEEAMTGLLQHNPEKRMLLDNPLLQHLAPPDHLWLCRPEFADRPW